MAFRSLGEKFSINIFLLWPPKSLATTVIRIDQFLKSDNIFSFPPDISSYQQKTSIPKQDCCRNFYKSYVYFKYPSILTTYTRILFGHNLEFLCPKTGPTAGIYYSATASSRSSHYGKVDSPPTICVTPLASAGNRRRRISILI